MSASLQELAGLVGGAIVGDPDTSVADATHDSARAAADMLFIAIRGERTDGHRHAAAAVAAGAAAVCVEDRLAVDVPQLVVPDTRSAMPLLAAAIHRHPSRRVAVVGITGTNGKTTVAHLIASVAAAAGRRVGVLGTVGGSVAGRPLPLELTTPEATDWQRLLALMAEEDVAVVAAEVSSHALAMRRVGGTEFAVAAFTNLSHDHLDFHGTMDAYFDAKASLFRDYEVGIAAVWIDDMWGERLADELDVPVLRVGRAGGDYHAAAVHHHPGGTSFHLVSPSGEVEVDFPLPGDFQLDNALVAAACCGALGIAPQEIGDGLRAAPPVPGRFEPVDAGQDYLAVVDYAHTPSGIERVIAAARRLGSRHVIVAVGAGGDRDAAKRAGMGAAASQADMAIITSDNPRSEDPESIIEAVATGVQAAGGSPVVEPDRRRAIRRAVQAAGPGDAVLILGKGHETGQDFGDHVLPFDDREVLRQEAGAA